jgi:hypothetical protein
MPLNRFVSSLEAMAACVGCFRHQGKMLPMRFA